MQRKRVFWEVVADICFENTASEDDTVLFGSLVLRIILTAVVSSSVWRMKFLLCKELAEINICSNYFLNT